jgi:hypothetical protein
MLSTKSMAAATAMVAIAALIGAAPVRAEVVTVTTQLSGKNEVPANNSSASGRARLTFDSKTNMLRWNVTYRGIAPSAGHLHGPAASGENAGVVVPFANVGSSPIAGSATLTEAQASDLLSGKWYVNLHSAAFGAGEIRGQVMPPARVVEKAVMNGAEVARTKQLNEQQAR